MKRSLSFEGREYALVLAGTGLIAGTYGLVRLAYGLFLPDIQESLAMGPALAGYVATGASVSYCAGALVGTAAAGRPRPVVAGALLTASVGAVAMALAPGTTTFAPAAVLASAGAGLASPGLVAIVQRNLSAARQDPGQATVNAGTGPGLVAAGVLALLVSSWQLGFVIAAVFTAAAGLGVLLLDRRDGPVHRKADATRPATGRWPVRLAVPATAALLLGTASAAVWTYGRAHLVEAGASETSSVLAWVALGVGGTATVLTARRLSTYGAERAWVLAAGSVAVAIAVLGLAPDRFAVAALACVLFGWGFVAATSALIAWTTGKVPERAAPGTSFLFVALVLGQGVGSAAAGELAERTGLSAVLFLSAALALGAAACARLDRDPRRPAGAAGRPDGSSLRRAGTATR